MGEFLLTVLSASGLLIWNFWRFYMFNKSIFELKDLLSKKETTSKEIIQSFLDRISAYNEKLNAFITVDEAAALKMAEDSDKRRESADLLSPFDGIPVALKDNICTKNIKTTCASKILSNFVPPFDATSFLKLKDQGFVLLGKTNCDEFAMGSSTENSFFGPAKNPFDPTRVPGGSSGGSAIAVSARMAPVTLGSDTGGSIRQPAAFCGTVGIKPTYGRVSRYGLVAFASSLDQIGTFGNNVDDAVELLTRISGHDSRDSTSIDSPIDFNPELIKPDVKDMVIGIPDEYFKGIDPEIEENIKKQVQFLEDAGAKVENISLKYTEYAIPVYYIIATAEASSNLARFDGVRYGMRADDVKNIQDLFFKSRSQGFGKEVKRRIILGTYSLSSGYYDAYYLKALKGRSLIINDFKKAFSKVDVIISPVTTASAFTIGEMVDDPLQMYISDILTISANLAGIPAMSVPVGLDSKGLPIGMQIMGNHFMEKNIFRAAKSIEKNTGTFTPTL